LTVVTYFGSEEATLQSSGGGFGVLSCAGVGLAGVGVLLALKGKRKWT